MTDLSKDSPLSLARERLQRLFEFLREFDQLRHPVVRHVDQLDFRLWLDELPEHESIERGWLDEDADFVLRVSRPDLRECPEPPRVLVDWLEDVWQDPETEVQIVEERRQPAVVYGDPEEVTHFNDDPERVLAFSRWMERRGEWAEHERFARRAMVSFERLYRLHGVLERESERFELFAGDAVLDWGTRSGRVHHPIVLQVMQLDFEAALPRFTISLGDRPPELYTSLLRAIDEIDGRALANATDEFDADSYHPFSGAEVDGFLQALVARFHERGEYNSTGPARSAGDAPAIGRRQMLLLRQRTQGYSIALEAIAEGLEDREDIPNSLLSIVGVEPPVSADSDDGISSDTRRPANENPDILFTKPANEEQAQIARRLERYRAVMVQGPPGTGKTHTIANLIGHLLAQGKRVLVTSHTAKALERVREVIVPDLQPLAVSVASGDNTGRAQLEQSVQAITDHLSSDNADQLRGEADLLGERRSGLIDELTVERRTLLEAIWTEYVDIVLGGEATPPADAAREIAVGRDRDDWIPSPVIGHDLPITIQEILKLYQTNASVSAEHERELGQPLPPLEELLTDERFSSLVDEERRLEASDQETGRSAWLEEPGESALSDLAELAAATEGAAAQVHDLRDWELSVLDAGRQAGGFREVWDELIFQVRSAETLAEIAAPFIARRGPTLPPDRPVSEVANVLAEVHSHVAAGGGLGGWVMLTHRNWSAVLNECSVAVGSPRDTESVGALNALAHLEQARERLEGMWQRTAELAGMPPASSLGAEPERGAAQFAIEIQRLLDWPRAVWIPLVERATNLGLDVDSLFALSAPRIEQHGELRRLVEVAGTHMPATIAALDSRIHLGMVGRELARFDETLSRFDRGRQSGDAVPAMREASHLRDSAAYAEQFERLVDLHSRSRDAQLRIELLTRLESVAPTWAAAIRARRERHAGDEPPGDVPRAWRWRVLNDELTRRASTDPTAVSARIDQLDGDLRTVTGELVSRLAWASQLDRTSLEQRQSLVGWMQAMTRVGRGTGKRVPRLLAQARESMAKSRSAVPVWIMPLSRVVETFDFHTTRFDVVIIDEASQSDVLALVALYLADQVVIVGDHEQVSPEAVGQRVDQFERLIDQFLRDIPNSELYDGRASIYDFGLASFGGLVQLREHFRSVPDIIEFSNQLSYRGSIEPLRDASDVQLRPHLVSERVSGERDGFENQAEADFIVSAILAACEFDEYRDAKFGVISMLQDSQARLIDSMLRQRMSPSEFARRRILVGSPPQFQGDERDVVFVSLVDSPASGPLPIRRDDRYKKRYNVAASRAKDQMWVVHSLDPERDLQADDLRARLIRHALTPGGFAQRVAAATALAESPFEEMVAKDLVREGYRVEPQYPVGAFRIDLVVHGDDDRRVAVECDGDRFHTRDDLARDLSRQAMLERLGWRFVRIRGSEYFGDAEATMTKVRARLDALGVHPSASDAQEQPETSDLLERVRARAAAIRMEWESPEGVVEAFDLIESEVSGEDSPVAFTDGDALVEEGIGAQDRAPIEGHMETRRDSPALRPEQPLELPPRAATGSVSDRQPATPTGREPGEQGLDGLAPYTVWEPVGDHPDPRSASLPELVDAIVDVVGHEGPVVGQRVYRLINRAGGSQRLTKPAIRALNRAAAAAARRGLIVESNPLGQAGQIHRVLRLPGATPVVMRERGPRELDELPVDEIAALSLKLLEESPTDSADELKRGLLATYRWQRLTKNVSAVFDSALSLAART